MVDPSVDLLLDFCARQLDRQFSQRGCFSATARAKYFGTVVLSAMLSTTVDLGEHADFWLAAKWGPLSNLSFTNFAQVLVGRSHLGLDLSDFVFRRSGNNPNDSSFGE